jgi:hypothetical protein
MTRLGSTARSAYVPSGGWSKGVCFKNVSRGRVKHEYAESATKAVKSRPSARPLGPTPGPPSRETGVPPSEDGVRGIAAYRETWPPSFTLAAAGCIVRDRLARRQRRGGRGLLARPAALRHARELERDPSDRLRLTVGLQRDGDRRVVTHEHHSFPDKT